MTHPKPWDSNDFWLELAKGAGLIGVFIGIIVLFGWLLDIPALKSISSSWVAMKANTALGFVLSGPALWLKASDPACLSPARHRLKRLLAVGVVLIGGLSLFEYLSGVDLGIDQWLFQEPTGAIGTLAPNRMAPVSALCFLLFGTALLMDGITANSRQRVSVLAILTALSALASVLIYLYDTDNIYGLGYFLQLALHTALVFLVLAAGLLCSQPEDGVVALLRRRDSGGALARRLLPVSLLLPLLVGWLKLYGERHDLYEPDFGVALVALGYIVMLGTLVVWGARFLTRVEAEREWMHASVAVSEARLRTLVSTIPDMIWLKDPDGVYLACNSAFERFFGAKERDIVGKTDYDFVSRELADFFRANDKSAIDAGGPRSNEEWVTLADSGQRILAETTKTPMYGSHGELLGVLGVARDITLRHESEAAIRAAKLEAERLLDDANRSRQELRDRNTFVETLLENAPIGFAVNSMDDGHFVFVSRRFAAIYGVTSGSLEGVGDFFDKVYPDPVERELIRLQVMTDIESGDPARMHWEDVEFTAVSGEQRAISAVNIPLAEQNLMISTVRDVTDRHRAESALRESERHFRSLFENMLDGYAYCRMLFEEGRAVDFIYLDVNESFGMLTGMRDVIGRKVSDLIPGIQDSNPDLFEIYGRTALTGQPAEFEAYVEGLSRWFSVSAYCPQKEHFVAVFDNITERKEAEQKLQQLNEELEQRVFERTTKLEAVNKELEAFSYSVSHDLRAPLRAIAGFVELLKKHNYAAIDDKGRHYMDVIAESAVQMGRLIDDILTFSRIGRIEMSLTHVDMNALLGEVRNTLRPQTEGRLVEWKISPLPEVTGERSMLSLVLQNLLSNALKFTQTRDVTVIEIGQVGGAADEWVFYVKDNGVGFDMRHVGKLFGLFQRLHAQEQFEGTGVGLANVQRIVLRHGGRVWAEGKVNEGATFYFALPKSRGQNEDTGTHIVG